MTDFRDMTATRRSEIGRLGGLAAHEKGTAHQWTTEEAKAAGRRGGKARAEKAKARAQEQQHVDENVISGTPPFDDIGPGRDN